MHVRPVIQALSRKLSSVVDSIRVRPPSHPTDSFQDLINVATRLILAHIDRKNLTCKVIEERQQSQSTAIDQLSFGPTADGGRRRTGVTEGCGKLQIN